jgi:hypothetical protein
MRRWILLFVQGFIIWLVPFGLAFFFYNAAGELVTSYALFKSVMLTSLTLTVLAVNLWWLDPAAPRGWAALIYYAVNLALDLLILVPMMGLTLGEYMAQIGLAYIIIPAITLAMGQRQRAYTAIASQ